MRCRVILGACALALLAACAPARVPASGDSAEQGKSTKPEGGADALRQRQEISRVLRDFGDSMEGVAARRVVELLDDSFEDLPRFEDALTALFRQTLERRIFLRESSWDVKGDRASVIVDAEMILTARSRARTQQRRRERLQFDLRKGAKGWRVVEISPRGFFAP